MNGESRIPQVSLSTRSVFGRSAEQLLSSFVDIATKVLSTRDDPTLPVLTFRTFFLGLGFSAFGSVLAQCVFKLAKLFRSNLLTRSLSARRIYYFKVGSFLPLPSAALIVYCRL